MGGNQDKSGELVAEKLISIIKEFNMTIDIEKLIREVDVDNSGYIDYEEFSSLLNQKDNGSTDKNFLALFAPN